MANVTIPSKHYVGMVVRTGSTVPLGFMTPWGEDAAAKNRMQTVDSWCKSGRKGSLPTTVIDNTPMLGFKMSGDIRRGMRGGQDKWRIVDPRGFELEITSENLSMLLADTTLEKGEILDQCVWAREGGQNLLLTTVSEEYIEAVKMTEIATSSASWKDAKLGNTVTLQNGISGRYLGKMHVVQEKYRDASKERDNSVESPGKLMHLILSPTTTHVYPAGVCRELHFIASPKLSSIQEGDEITVAEAELLANDAIRDPKCYIIKGGYRDIILAAANPIKDLSWRFSLEDVPDDVDPWERGYHNDICLARMKGGTLGVCRKSNNEYSIIPIHEEGLQDGIYDHLTEKHASSSYYYGRNTVPHWGAVSRKVNPKDVISYHHLRIELDTKAGNTVWNNI